MRYWWVNQNQTYQQESRGGYPWSPKRNADGNRNPFYEFMREVAPGDTVFSFANTRIQAIGQILSYCYESPRPLEFGISGPNWNPIGWRVRVKFSTLESPIRPKDEIEFLRPALPKLYSPLQQTGNGNQGVYLTEVQDDLAARLFSLIGSEAESLARTQRGQDEIEAEASREEDTASWEREIADVTLIDPSLDVTQRKAIIMARVGQGLFKQRVLTFERRCRVTGVIDIAHLRASHCKPWRSCTNQERLDGENGLLLTPTIDHLFDRGFIAFRDNGELISSPVISPASLSQMGIASTQLLNVGPFTAGQKAYLSYHRDAVFLQSSRSDRG